MLRKMFKKKILVIAIIIIVIVIVINLHPRKTTSKHEILDIRSFDKNTKTILLWNDFFSTEHFGLPLGSNAFAGCEVKNCQIWDRLDSEPDLPHDRYDALVFHGIDTGASSIRDLPSVRRPNQRYMFLLEESPIMRPNFYNLPYFFNWTATYRRDSDIDMYYIITERKYSTRNVKGFKKIWLEPTFENKEVIPEFFTNKSKQVVWFVSNSAAQSKRDLYANVLAKYISVDIYGRGRPLSCSRDDTKCEDMLDTTYKFYLAFENSLCEDYVTEKFPRVLNHYIVPIVYGGADYKYYAPPLSYIDVKDFASPKELARYLFYLDRNPEEYRTYFWWKEFYQMERQSLWCDVCEKLHDPKEPNKVYADMNFWWNYPGVCWTPRDHFCQGLNC